MSNALSLKESFRQLNFLEKNISTLSRYLSNTSNAITIKEIHQKSKVNQDAVDETIDMTAERTYPNASIVDIAFLVKQLVDQKLELSLEIENAKRNLVLEWTENGVNLTLDSAVEYAKKSRELADNLKSLVDIKSSEGKKTGSAYKFNVEGNQVSYKYEILTTNTIDFNRNNVNDLYKKLLNKADTLSTQIESSMLKNIVEFVPTYDIHDSVAEIVEQYLSSK